MSGEQRFRLVPLDCPSCGAQVEAEALDVVYYCTACRNGYRFDDAECDLEPLEVGFVAAPQVAAERYLPVWLLPAEVELLQRSGGGFSGLMGFFFGAGEDSEGPSKGTFAVPAFQAPIGAVAALTRHYTEKLPHYGERLGERLLGGRYGVDDARKLAHYAVIATEVGKPDTLRELRYRIRFGAPRLLGVPFTRRGDQWVDSLFSVSIGTS